MKREELEKYVGELSPEMQEKARACKTMEELNTLLAENDVELSEDALQAVAGGCSASDDYYKKGDPVLQDRKAICPSCGGQLYYWDMCHGEKGCTFITRMYCSNSACSSFNNGLWYCEARDNGCISRFANEKIQKY